MSPKLQAGLSELGRLMNDVQSPWWIIGSTALVLSGVANIEPDDIDVVSDGETLRTILHKNSITVEAIDAHPQFRSNPYQRLNVENGTSIELMGDLDVHDGVVFRPLTINTRKTVQACGYEFYIPAIVEQISILRQFGREKDLLKAAILEQHIH